MASTINASNSGFGGIVSTGDSSGQLQLQTANTTAVTIDTSQNVGIGTTSPSYKLDVVGGINASSNISTASGNFVLGTNDTYLGFASNNIKFNNTSDRITLNTGAAERMRIDSSGNTILGSNTSTTAYNKLNLWSPASTLNGIFMEKQSQVVVQMGFKANTNTDFFIGTGSYTLGTYGVYLANTGTSWISVSDERQKDIIEPIENALTKVNTLRTVIGKYKHDEEGVRRSFLIAQDVQAVFPEAVKTQNDEEALLGLSYTDVIPLLVAAIKEQQTIINDLKARIETLEAK